MTPSGTPPGSIPTETTGARERAGTDHERIAPFGTTDGTELVTTDENELTGDAAPRQPVGSPARQSDLSVSPISTCLTSLVIRGSANPDPASGAGGKVDDL